MGLPLQTNSSSFAKADFFHSQKVEIVPEKLNFIWQVQGGIIRPLLSGSNTAINDRFFITHPMGYTHIGHLYESNIPKSDQNEFLGQEIKEPIAESETPERTSKHAVGDDLGSMNYLLSTVRMEFLNIPFLKDIHLKTFAYAELALYPSMR